MRREKLRANSRRGRKSLAKCKLKCWGRSPSGALVFRCSKPHKHTVDLPTLGALKNVFYVEELWPRH